MIAAAFVTMCALKLLQCGEKIGVYTYPGIAERALGRGGKIVVDIFLSFCQFSFTVAQISFTLKTLQSIILINGQRIDLWYFAIGIICFYSPLAWVRRLQYFAIGYILGCAMIIYTVAVVSGYSVAGLVESGPRQPHQFYMVNPDTAKVWDMIGFSFYSFEGIGTVMPIYENTKSTVNYRLTVAQALGTLALLFSSFGLLCYGYFGHMDEKKSFVIQNLDETNIFIKVTRLLFCVNLVFSYPLTIYPTNKSIESFLFVRMLENTWQRKWLKNLSRTVVCFLGCFLSITFTNVLDHFLGVSGAVLGIPIILITPTLCHYKLVAESKLSKRVDVAFILFAIAVMILCAYNGIAAWVAASSQE